MLPGIKAKQDIVMNWGNSLRLIFHAKIFLFVLIAVKPRKANGLDMVCVSSN